MSELEKRLLQLLQNPRVASLLQKPSVQQTVIKGFRYRGRVEEAFNEQVQRIADKLNLATQRDLRALHRKVRHLEQELREAEQRLTEAEDAREALDRK